MLTCVEGEPAEAGLLLLCPALQDRLVEPHSIVIVTVATVQSHSHYFPAAVDGSHAPHRHPPAQTVEVSAGQQVGPQKAGGGRAADVDPSGSATAALRVVVLPRRPLEDVQHLENPLLSVGFVQEESDGQRGVAWNSFGEIFCQPCRYSSPMRSGATNTWSFSPATGLGGVKLLKGEALSETWKMRRLGHSQRSRRSRECCNSRESPGLARRCTFISRSCCRRCHGDLTRPARGSAEKKQTKKSAINNRRLKTNVCSSCSPSGKKKKSYKVIRFLLATTFLSHPK